MNNLSSIEAWGIVGVFAGLFYLSFLTKRLGPFARVGAVILTVSTWAFILVPEQIRLVPLATAFLGALGIALNRWDGHLPGLARKPRP